MRAVLLRTAGIAAQVLLLSPAARAAPLVTLSPSQTSTVDASVYSTIPADYNSTVNLVTALPYTAPSTADGVTGDFSTVTPDLTSTEFAFTYSENLANAADYYADSDGDILFVAGPNVQYTIAGSETVSNPTNTFIVQLNDVTQSLSAFGYQQSDSDTLDLASGTYDGSLVGTLTAGDTYEFYADQDLNNGQPPDPTLAGSASITFAPSVPEPTAAALALLSAALIASTTVRKRTIAAACPAPLRTCIAPIASPQTTAPSRASIQLQPARVGPLFSQSNQPHRHQHPTESDSTTTQKHPGETCHAPNC